MNSHMSLINATSSNRPAARRAVTRHSRPDIVRPLSLSPSIAKNIPQANSYSAVVPYNNNNDKHDQHPPALLQQQQQQLGTKRRDTKSTACMNLSLNKTSLGGLKEFPNVNDVNKQQRSCNRRKRHMSETVKDPEDCATLSRIHEIINIRMRNADGQPGSEIAPSLMHVEAPPIVC